MKKVILLLGIDGTQTLPIAKSLYLSGDIVVGFYTDKYSYGYNSKYVHKKILSPSIQNSLEYFSFTKTYLEKNKVDCIIPMGDLTAEMLSIYKVELSKLSNFIIPTIDIFNMGYNKNLLMKYCKDHNFPHPQTIDLSVNVNTISDDFFPALIKPNIMTGGRGMTLVRNKLDFLATYKNIIKTYGAAHLQQFIPNGGKQYKVQVFISPDGKDIYTSVINKQRYYPINGGSSCCNTTIQYDALAQMCVEILRGIEWCGFADFDLIEDPKDKQVKVMEINPRVPACIKSAFVSNIDYAQIIKKYTLGIPCKGYSYTPGKTLRFFSLELLWFFKSKDRWNTFPSWFNFIGSNIYYQDVDIRDLKSFMYGTYANIKKLLNPKFRKQKSGLK